MLRMTQTASLAFSTSKAYFVTKRILRGKSEYIKSILQNDKEYQWHSPSGIFSAFSSIFQDISRIPLIILGIQPSIQPHFALYKSGIRRQAVCPCYYCLDLAWPLCSPFRLSSPVLNHKLSSLCIVDLQKLHTSNCSCNITYMIHCMETLI